MTLPRLLSGVTRAPAAIEQHLHHHGELPHRPGLIDEIAASGVRGRGGAAFPLSFKLDVVRRSRRAPVLVVNGCEGEPMSAKDRLLLCMAPHLVLDGAVAVARAVGAAEILVAVDELNLRAIDTVAWAVAQRREPHREGLSLEVLQVPGGYVSGQESAIVRWINEGVASPAPATQRVTERGVRRRPTLVCNVETLAHVALIARHGARWFREVGTPEDPGSTLVTVSGAVARPGVLEVAHGSSLASLVNAAGGLAARPRAFLVGGYAGGWIDVTEARSARLSRAGLRPHGARLGPGIVVALAEGGCPVAETARVGRWLAEHSAGQCGPCVHGLDAIADQLEAVCHGTAGDSSLGTIARWCDQVTGRGACAHPDGAASFVASALRVFGDELADHARYGLCDGCHLDPVLLTPNRPVAIA